MSVKVRERPPGSGRWYLFIDYRGRRKAKYVGTEKAAKLAAIKIEARLALGEFQIEERKVQTFKDYREYWLRTYVTPHCKYSTAKGYESVFRIHLSVFDGKALEEITRQDISELISKKLVESKKSQSTVRNILAPLREMFNHAVDEGILKANPATRIGRFIKHTSSKANRLKIDPLNREEVSTLLETAMTFGYDVYALLLCAVRTGMRMGELFGLQWPDLDFHSRFVQVQRSRVRGRIETPKSGQLRRVDMSKQLGEGLQELDRRRHVLFFTIRAEAGQLRASGSEEDAIRKTLACKHQQTPQLVRYILATTGQEMPSWVFFNDEGQPLDHNNFRKRVFEKVLTKAGVRRIRFHDLRHTYASLLLQQGETPQYVQQQMGHHSIQVTVDIYGHLIPGTNRRAVDRLDDRLIRPRRTRKHPQPHANPAQTTRRLKIATNLTH